MSRTPCFNTPEGLCNDYPNATCVVYTGVNLTCLGVNTNDRLDDILSKINDILCDCCGGPGGGGGSGSFAIEAGDAINITGIGTIANPKIVNVITSGFDNTQTDFMMWTSANEIKLKTLASIISDVEIDILNNNTFLTDLINTLFDNSLFIDELNQFITDYFEDVDFTNIANSIFNTFNSTNFYSISTDCIPIPTSHPTQITLTIGTGLSYIVGDSVTIYADATHYFTGTVVSYNSLSGVLVVDSVSNVGTGTFCSWVVNLSSLFGLSVVITEDTVTVDLSGNGTLVSPLTADVIVAPGCNAILVTDDGLLAIPTSSTYLISGGEITYIGPGYTYEVAGGSAVVNCEDPCTFPDIVVVLSAADPTFSRVDAVVIDSMCNVLVLEGTPSLNPVAPFVDSSLYLGLTYIWIAAGSTAPIPDECAYLNNAEWTGFSSTVRINLNSTNFPAEGTKDIEATLAVDADYFTLTRGLAIVPMNWTELSLKIRSKGYWGDKGIFLRLYYGGSPVGSVVPLFDTQYGFNSNQTTTYQNIRIPINSFGLNTIDLVDEIRATIITPNFGSIGFYLDQICFIVAPFIPTVASLFFQNGLTRTGNVVEHGGYLLHTTLLDTRYNQYAIGGISVYTPPLEVSQGQQWEVSSEVLALWHKGQLNAANPLGEISNPVKRRFGYFEEEYVTNVTLPGPMGDESGYTDTWNIWNYGSYGYQQDSSDSKWGGVLQHTFDTAYNNYLFTWFGDDAADYPLGIPAISSTMATQRRFAIRTTGQLQGFQYGVGTFDDTPARIAGFDALGNIIEVVPSSISGTTYTVNNGLTESPATNFQLGGTLIQGTTINATVNYGLTVTGSAPESTYLGTLVLENTGTQGRGLNVKANGFSNNIGIVVEGALGTALYATTISGTAIRGNSTGSGTGITAQSTDGLALKALASPSSTGTVIPITELYRQTSGTATAGIGESIDLYLQSTTGTQLANQLISKWSTATGATRTSEFSLTGVDSAVTATLLTVSGNGRTRLNKYGVGTFTGVTAYVSGWDSSGNFIEINPSSLGTDTNFAINDLTATGNRLHTFNTYNTEITYNGLTSGFGWKLSSTATGATGNTQKLFVVDLSGANSTASQTTYGGYITNSHSGTSPRNIGMYATTTNGITTSAGFWGEATTQYGVLGTATSGSGVRGEATSGAGVYGTATSGNGVTGTSVTGVGGGFSSSATGMGGTSTGGGLGGFVTTVSAATGSVLEIFQINRSVTGTATVGVGGKIGYYAQTDGGLLRLSNELISKWTTVANATRVSDFSITGVSSASTQEIFGLSGTGATRMPLYGDGIFTGTPTYIAAWDTNGNVIEVSPNSFTTGLTNTSGTITWDGVNVRKNSTGSVYTRRRINFIEGSAVTLTVADDAGNDEIDVTIAFSGGGTATLADGDYGDVTVSSTGTVITIDADAVTFAKMQDITTDRLLGRDTAGTGNVEEISLNATLEFTGSASIQRAALTGDVTASAGSNTTTIANNAVLDTKLRDSGALSVIGRSVNSSGDPADISGTASTAQVLRISGVTLGFGTIDATYISDFTEAAQDAVGAMINASLQYTDGTPLLAINDRDFGDITTSGSGLTWTIDNDVVTFAKMQNISTNKLIGRSTASTGDPEEISIGTGLSLSAGTLSNSGLITADNGLTAASNNVKWGGTLTANTTIAQATKSITFSNSGDVQFLCDPTNSTYKFGASDAYAWRLDINSDVGGGTAKAKLGAIADGSYLEVKSGHQFNLYWGGTLRTQITESDGFYTMADDSSPSTLKRLLTLEKQVVGGGTPTAGLGTLMMFLAPSTTTNGQITGYYSSFWSNAVHANMTSVQEIWGMNNASLTRKAAFHGNGDVTLDGYPSSRNDGAVSSGTTKLVYVDSTGKLQVGTATFSGSSSGHTIQEDGTPLGAETNLNFSEGLLATDDAGNSATKVVLVGWDQWRVSTLTSTTAVAQTVVSISTTTDSRGILVVDMVGTETGTVANGLTGTKYVHWKNVAGTVTVLQVIDEQADYREGWTTTVWTVDASTSTLRIRVTPENTNSTKWNASYKLKFNTY